MNVMKCKLSNFDHNSKHENVQKTTPEGWLKKNARIAVSSGVSRVGLLGGFKK